MVVFLVQCVNTEGCQQESIETEEFTQTCCHCVTFHFHPSLSPFEWWKLKAVLKHIIISTFHFLPTLCSQPYPACANTMHKSSFYSTAQ